MEISSIYINTYRKDFHLARICIASIRYWYPGIPIRLIKDMGAGDFDSSSLERLFDVGVLDTGKKSFGWGFGKFEPLFRPSGESFFFMDADTVMTGPLLDRLSGIEADFIVDEEVQPRDKLVALYYDPDSLKELDPSFEYPGYTFNTGQWAATAGLLSRSDFDPYIEWGTSPSLHYPGTFRQADQGVFNYLVQKKHAQGSIRLARVPLMIWPEGGAADHVDLEAIRRRKVMEDRVIHWAGMKNTPHSRLPRRDVIDFFTEEYYRRAGAGQRLRDLLEDSFGYLSELPSRVWRRLTRMGPRR
jgi:hypothetical protein